MPANENTLSDEAGEAGTDNTHRVNFDSLGYVLGVSSRVSKHKTHPECSFENLENQPECFVTSSV